MLVSHAWAPTAVRRIPCAVHRPPHQKGRRHSAGKCKSVATALIKALCHECEAQRKACQNMPPKLSKIQPDTPPNPPKSRPGASLGAKMHPRHAQEQPEGTQERSRDGQEAPKSCQEGAQERPRGAQDAPRRHPNPTKSESGEARRRKFISFMTVLLAGACAKRPSSIFGQLSRMASQREP